jgi:hypothetical protein
MNEKPKARLEQDVEEALMLLAQFPEPGINLDEVTQLLEDEGVEKFFKHSDKLMTALEKMTWPNVATLVELPIEKRQIRFMKNCRARNEEIIHHDI